MVEEIPPRGSEANASRQARQKLRAQRRLELLDVPGQRGLGNPDFVRGAGDASFIRDLHEVLDAAQFHGFAPSRSRNDNKTACAADAASLLSAKRGVINAPATLDACRDSMPSI